MNVLTYSMDVVQSILKEKGPKATVETVCPTCEERNYFQARELRQDSANWLCDHCNVIVKVDNK